MEKGLTKAQIIAELTKSPHAGGAGKRKKGEKLPKLTPQEKLAARTKRLMDAYYTVGGVAAVQDPDFFAHLIAWNHAKGSVRDAQVALPGIALAFKGNEREYQENALAHLADLRPKEFERGVSFARSLGVSKRLLGRLVERYLRDLEANWGEWERTAVQHRQSLKRLGTVFQLKPPNFAQANVIRHEAPLSQRFEVLARLRNLTPEQIAGEMAAFKLPFLIVSGALRERLKEPDVLTAIIQRMTPGELVTNTKRLEKLGFKNIPSARAAFEEGLKRVAGAKQVNLKVQRASEAIEDEQLKTKLQAAQEKQIQQSKGIEGNWLVLGDRSGSMSAAIELAKEVAGTLARFVKGNVYLVFFDDSPTFYDVTGKTLEEIKQLTKGIRAGGSTSIGCGLQALLDKKLTVEGIAVVTDGGENHAPYFYGVYPRYCEVMGVQPTIYCYATEPYAPNFESFCARGGIDVTRIRVGEADYASLPNVVQTMRTGRYGLLEEVMETPLRTLDEVLERTKGYEVIKQKESDNVGATA